MALSPPTLSSAQLVRFVRRVLRLFTAILRTVIREELSASAEFQHAANGKLLTLSDAADVLGVSKRTVERLVRRGKIAVVRTGRSSRIHPAALDAYIRAQVRGPPWVPDRSSRTPPPITYPTMKIKDITFYVDALVSFADDHDIDKNAEIGDALSKSERVGTDEMLEIEAICNIVSSLASILSGRIHKAIAPSEKGNFAIFRLTPEKDDPVDLS